MSAIDTDTDTDNQTIDQLSLNGKTLQISIEDDGEAIQQLDLSSIDNQTIDGLELDGTTLKISLENDGEAAVAIDLASIDTNTDTQLSESEVLTIINNNGFITDPDDGDADPTNEIELPSGGTDGQLLKTDGEGNYSWVDDSDDQTIDSLTLTDDVLAISLENDGADALTVDFSNLSKTLLQDTDEDTRVQVEANSDEDYIRFSTQDIEAVQINSNQQVGIGKTPTARLTVSTGAGGTAVSSASNGASHTNDNSGSRWQSYTATVDGQIDYIEITYNNGSGTPSMTVYKGAGTDGAILGTITADATGTDNHTVTFDLSSAHIDQVVGEQYTFELDEWERARLTIDSRYNGGTLSNDTEWDMAFNVYVKEYLAGFQVGNEGVTINDYTLPTTDGTAGQVLTTDGMGNVTWADAAATLQSPNTTVSKMQARLDQLEAENETLKAQVVQITELEQQLLQLRQLIQSKVIDLPNNK